MISIIPSYLRILLLLLLHPSFVSSWASLPSHHSYKLNNRQRPPCVITTTTTTRRRSPSLLMPCLAATRIFNEGEEEEEEGLVAVVSERRKKNDDDDEEVEMIPGLLQVPILPAWQSLCESLIESTKSSKNNDHNNNDDAFSILTWNILLPNSDDNDNTTSTSTTNWWNHKMYNPWVDMKHRQWPHRQALIQQRLVQSQADIICLQEVNGETFHQDFAFLLDDTDNGGGGYEACLLNKYRFKCATFFKRDKFCLEQVAHKDRTLVTSLKVRKRRQQRNINGDDVHDDPLLAYNRMIHVVNCHLSGGAVPEQRLRQVHEALDQIRKWKQKVFQVLEKQLKANRPNARNIELARHVHDLHQEAASTTLVVGDFNSEGNTAVRRLLVEGCVAPEWREPQYPTVPLTSKPKHNPLLPPVAKEVGGNDHDSSDSVASRSRSATTCTFVDVAELAYGANVCDGDYGEGDFASLETCRPPTYVVPNLASLLLSSPPPSKTISANNNTDDLMVIRTQFGRQVAQGLADTLSLQSFTRDEMQEAFQSVDVNGDDYIDEHEVQVLLESVYFATFEKQIRVEKERFFQGCFSTNKQRQLCGSDGLTRDEFIQTIKALQQQQKDTGPAAATTTTIDHDFGQRLSKGVMDSLGLLQDNNNDDNKDQELDLIQSAFDKVDLNGNGRIDESEIQSLLESAFAVMNGDRIEAQKKMFFSGFQDQEASSSSSCRSHGLTLDQFIVKLSALQQELHGGSQGAELVQVKTTTDAQRMITRFSPLLQSSLDLVFAKFSRDGECLTQDEMNEFLMRANDKLGRGGTFRHTAAILERKRELQEPLVLTRQDWYEVFARELAEGKWWQVVYDLETCGANIRPQQKHRNAGEHVYRQDHSQMANPQHYQAWLDYIYFDTQRLACRGLQEALTISERMLIYKDGDALPNAWHPSDHLPVAAIFAWNNA